MIVYVPQTKKSRPVASPSKGKSGRLYGLVAISSCVAPEAKLFRAGDLNCRRPVLVGSVSNIRSRCDPYFAFSHRTPKSIP